MTSESVSGIMVASPEGDANAHTENTGRVATAGSDARATRGAGLREKPRRSRPSRVERQRRYEKTPGGQYVRHKQNARRRGVAFELTFEEWWGIWTDSGHWSQRGNRLGDYCMKRNGDRGPYAVGNVTIGDWSSNTAECNRSRWEPSEDDDPVPF